MTSVCRQHFHKEKRASRVWSRTNGSSQKQSGDEGVCRAPGILYFALAGSLFYILHNIYIDKGTILSIVARNRVPTAGQGDKGSR